MKKVVLAQALEVELQDTPALGDIVTHLGEQYPSCYRFIIEPVTPVSVDQGVDTNINAIQPQSEQIPDASQPPAFFGATPERLVSVRGRTVETGALAGTTGRGETVAEDEWLAAELARDEKNIHEHELVAETIRDQLSPYATAITSDSRRVRKLATVQHLWTPITATLEEDQHALSLVEALHPTPAVGDFHQQQLLRRFVKQSPLIGDGTLRLSDGSTPPDMALLRLRFDQQSPMMTQPHSLLVLGLLQTHNLIVSGMRFN